MPSHQLPAAIFFYKQESFHHILWRKSLQLKRKNGRIITNKKEISEHGYGLELLRMMSEKYDGKMTVHTYPGIFEIELALEIKDT